MVEILTQEDINYYEKQKELANELLTENDERILMMRINDIFTHAELNKSNKLPFIMNYIEWEKKLNKFLPESNKLLHLAQPNQCVSVTNAYGSIGVVLTERMSFNDRIAEYVARQMWIPTLFIHNWEVYKQVYTFEENCLDFLMNNAEYKEVPVDMLANNLPYNSFYIDNTFTIDKEKYIGVIVSKTKREDGKNWLGFYMIRETKDYDFRYAFLPLEEGKGTILELMDLKEVIDYNVDECITKLLSLVLYLCSYNKEIRPLKEKNSYERNHEKHREKAGIKSEELGFIFGATIKMSKKTNTTTHSSHEGSHNSKRPHTRCAHYQRYWTGAKGSPDRKAVIKFIPPLFINGGSNVAVIHKVKQ